MRVLVVEDEAALRETLKTRLTDAGFTVDVAQDGEEGLFAGREYPLDVAVIVPSHGASVPAPSFAPRGPSGGSPASPLP